jgi:hypothetical protein
MSSILNDIKHLLGRPAEETVFDSDITLHINSVFGTLTQLGVGPVVGFAITGKDEQWEDYMTDPRLNAVKSYIFMRVKLLFNPPDTGFQLQAFQDQIKELEYRLNVVADYG